MIYIAFITNVVYYAIADVYSTYLDCCLCFRMLTNAETIRAVTATPNNADRIVLSFEVLPSEQDTVNKIVIIIRIINGYHIRNLCMCVPTL